jgi:Flp pilus assembly protein TadD
LFLWLRLSYTSESPRKTHKNPCEATPSLSDVWAEFQQNLTSALEGLENDEFLVIVARPEHYYVQFAGQGEKGMRADAVSNTFIRPEFQLSEAARQSLGYLGWSEPTYVPVDSEKEPMNGSPNYHVDMAAPVPHARLAALAVKTLRQIYRVRYLGELTYKALAEDNTSIRFPSLKIQREALTPATNGSGISASREVPAGAAKDPSATPTFVLPDGVPTSAQQVEADLVARITASEEVHEGALWQLARFYSMVGRYEEATAAVNRCIAATRDQAKQAAGCLGLGQLLEQQDRYAEAKAMYARGAEIPTAPAEVAYFLHNNRGYCLNILGRHAEAEAQCRPALAIDPARHNAHKNLGLALAGQGRLAEAARSLLEADGRCPGDPRARGHLRALLTENPEILESDPAFAAACRERGIRPGQAGSA